MVFNEPGDAILEEWEQYQDDIVRSRRTWEGFMQSGRVPIRSDLQAEVLSSWIRCRNRGMDPHSEELVVVPRTELGRRQRENRELVRICAPILRELAEGINDKGIRFDLYDADTILLDRFADEKNPPVRPKRELPPGTSQQEQDAGTNAVCLSLLLGKPMQLTTYEHYRTQLHSLTASSVPIRGVDGRMVGAIAVDLYPWPIHKHTLGMLIATRRSIEYGMRQNYYEFEELKDKLSSLMIEQVRDACVVVNGGGTILFANQGAGLLLQGDQADMTGRSCDVLWGERNPFTEVIRSARAIVEREVVFDLGARPLRLLGTLRPVLSDKGSILAVLGIFRNRRAGGVKKSREGLRAYYTFENLIHESEEMRQCIRLARETATMHSNTLIQAESGTGKELLAQAMHNASLYKDGPFVTVNCSAIPEGLLESELFGYEGGAFTGAKKEGSIGKFEMARGGTIFLDEINSMPLDMQAKILRVIQNKTVTRVGGMEEIPINVRIICAANVDLWEMVRRERFREDLFYRIHVITINIPPLRKREGDLELLMTHILRRLGNSAQVALGIDEDAVELLRRYHWPGNVRELENVLERSMVLARTRGSNTISRGDVLSYRGIAELAPATAPPAAPEPDGGARRDLQSLEKEEITRALHKNGGNILRTAKELGIARNTLYRKIDRYNIR